MLSTCDHFSRFLFLFDLRHCTGSSAVHPGQQAQVEKFSRQKSVVRINAALALQGVPPIPRASGLDAHRNDNARSDTFLSAWLDEYRWRAQQLLGATYPSEGQVVARNIGRNKP